MLLVKLEELDRMPLDTLLAGTHKTADPGAAFIFFGCISKKGS